MIYLVTYDLNKSGQDYQSLYNKIKSLGQAFHALQNLWLLSSSYNASSISTELRKVVDANDAIFIAQLYKGSYTAWMSREAHDWLEARL